MLTGDYSLTDLLHSEVGWLTVLALALSALLLRFRAHERGVYLNTLWLFLIGVFGQALAFGFEALAFPAAAAVLYTIFRIVAAIGAIRLVGFAVDGFPIYAKWGYNVATDSTSGVRAMTSSWKLKTTPDNGRVDPSIVAMGTFTVCCVEVSRKVECERMPSRSTVISAVASSQGDLIRSRAVSPGLYVSCSGTISMRLWSYRSHAVYPSPSA